MNVPADDILIRVEGRAGRITLNRPRALNALTHEMGAQIGAALDAWVMDDAVALVLIDAAGDKAFCAGGDIEQLYRHAVAGDFAFARSFWRDEYRLNAKIARYAKPVVTLMQGFVMGGGVGIGCHAAYRVVGESSRIAMPECGIGLVPDVGGSLILAKGPGRVGEYLGTTAARMNAADAIHAGFAGLFVPEDAWPKLAGQLVQSGEVSALARAAGDPGASPLAETAKEIDRIFAGETPADIVDALENAGTDFAGGALQALSRVSPLSAATTVELVRRSRTAGRIEAALELEFRATWRAVDEGDLIEGIRAAIIDKDRAPRWRHENLRAVPASAVEHMLAPLGDDTLALEEST